MVVDAGRIRALGRRLHGEAERVRGVALRVAATREVPWRSPAAEAFRERVDERAARLRREADALAESADLLGEHATAVEAALEAAQVARVRAEELAREAARDVARRLAGRGTR